MKTNRAVIVQCRLSSTRLPGKALKELGGKPVLAWVLESMKKVNADKYYVATDPDSYEQLLPVCEKYGFQCFSGDLNDVLKRFCDLIKKLDVKTIIRATADNPFLFYEAAEESAKDFEERNKGKLICDYLTWSGLPHGSGVEIFRADSLLKAAAETSDPYDHEHVGPSLYNHTDKFNCQFIKAPARYNHPQLRTTIDTYSDYLHAIQIVDAVCKKNKIELNKITQPFTTEQIVEACKTDSVKKPVVLVPSVKKGCGTGHLHRCLSAAINNPFFVYIPKNKTLLEADEIINQYIEKGLNQYQIIEELPGKDYSPVYVTDLFEISEDQIKEFSVNSGLISIDEGSDFTDYSDYILDIIPSYKIQRKANLKKSAFIQKPINKRKDIFDKNNVKKILICLGGEDPAGITMPAANSIAVCYPKAEVEAIVSDSTKQNSLVLEKNIKLVAPIKDLREKLFNYDLVITHYGLTAFEAAYAGCGVVLMSTTKLHENLAKEYNFAYVSGTVNKDSMLKALSSKNVLPESILSDEKEDLGNYINRFSSGMKNNCPICDKENLSPDSIVSRNISRTYRRCKNCGMVYIAYSIEPEKKYEKQYFFEEYKKQYGKTYQEDFESIKTQCKRRLQEIKKIAGNCKEKSVLDIGCAYGPFLSAAVDFNMNAFGTDISQDAISYVQNELKIPAVVSAFPNMDAVKEFGVDKFDLVTMWYVIEHFKNLDEVLLKVSSMVNKGGIFAFSTPSGEGVSAKSNKDDFYEISPSDHYTVWEPSRVKKILKRYGFEVVKIVSTGHHPERFPSIKSSGAKKGDLKWNFISHLSEIKKLGDTMEIYCKKI